MPEFTINKILTKLVFSLLAFHFFAFTAIAQNKITIPESDTQEDKPGNPELSALIDSLKDDNQKWRQRLMRKQNGETDTLSVLHINNQINKTDKKHYPIIVKIFLDYGYPSYNLIGKKSAHNYWLLVQHQDHQKQFQEKI